MKRFAFAFKCSESGIKSLVWLIVETYVTDQAVLSIRAVKHTVNGIVKIAARAGHSLFVTVRTEEHMLRVTLLLSNNT